MDLAAPFGPVAGLTTSLHFTDLLNLETAPHQVATVASVNPGITVENGVIQYQILPNNWVKVERGEWPFMGGQLILEETVLDFNGSHPKKLTFRAGRVRRQAVRRQPRLLGLRADRQYSTANCRWCSTRAAAGSSVAC